MQNPWPKRAESIDESLDINKQLQRYRRCIAKRRRPRRRAPLAPHTDESRTPFGLSRSGPSQTGKSSPTAPHQDPHYNRYRHTWHDRASARLSRDGVGKCCCHAKLLFWGEVSLRARRTGYMRLRMGSISSAQPVPRPVRWEPCSLRCSALGTRVPSVGKLAMWSRWSR